MENMNVTIVDKEFSLGIMGKIMVDNKDMPVHAIGVKEKGKIKLCCPICYEPIPETILRSDKKQVYCFACRQLLYLKS